MNSSSFSPKSSVSVFGSGTLGWRTNSLWFGCISWAQLQLQLHQVTAECIGFHLESTLGNSGWICDSGFPKSCWWLSFQRAGVGSESKWQVRFPWALFTLSNFESELIPHPRQKKIRPPDWKVTSLKGSYTWFYKSSWANRTLFESSKSVSPCGDCHGSLHHPFFRRLQKTKDSSYGDLLFFSNTQKNGNVNWPTGKKQGSCAP